MNYKSKLFILGLVSKIFAANFSVVSFDGACQLNVGGSLVNMTPDPACPNLYKATANAKVGTEYNYVCGGKEDVKRVLKEENTHNELVGRALTVYDMPEFGYPNAEPWNRSIGRTELFDPDYVPIVIMDGSKDYFVSASGLSSFKKVTFILKDSVFTFDDVKLVETKNTGEDKFQMEIELPNGGIFNRDILKFRPSSYDPSFIRQILYGDIAHAIGNPAHESVAARVYSADGTPIGLYVLQENVASESFVRTAFYGNPENGSVKQYTKTPIYNCATNADFNYNDPLQLGPFINNTFDLKIQLKEMTRQIDLVDINDNNAVKNVDDNWLDLDTLYRALALEYLGGHWDSFWFLTTNFVTYHPFDEAEGPDYQPTKYKFYFIDQDFDQTFSIGLKEQLDLVGKPYTDFVNKPADFWTSMNEAADDRGSRVFLNKFIGCNGQPTCETRKLFESHLQSIVQHIFNPVAIGRKVDGYRARLDDEVKWDHSFQRLHTGSERLSASIDNYEKYDQSFTTGVCSSHGLLTWVAAMADHVCSQFGIKYDEVALTPETAAKVDAKPIDPGTNYDANASLSAANDAAHSGAMMNKVNASLAMIYVILSIVLFL